jgi:hypothetical protein
MTGFAVCNILQYYFGTGEDHELPGLIPGDTLPPVIGGAIGEIFGVTSCS